MKHSLLFLSAAAVLSMSVAASPVRAAEMTVREKSCQHDSGTNTLTYDCAFKVDNYTLSSPVTFKIAYSCTGTCGPVLSFGTRGSGFSPTGVLGRLVGGKRVPGGIEVTFVFDSLQRSGTGNMTGHSKEGPGNRTGHDGIGWAHFSMNLSMDDGHGNMQTVPCDVDVKVKE